MARKTPGLNTSSMADISFLLLAFFLMVSDIKTDKGIARVLPKYNPEKKADKAEVHERDIFTVLVNGKDEIKICQNGVWDKRSIPIHELKDRVKRFLNSNRGDDPMLPELEPTYIEEMNGTYKVSKGIISLQCHNSTTYDKYFQVQNELTAAVNELRDELSRRKYGQAYNPDPSVESVQKTAVEKAIPMKISEAKPSNIGGSN